MNLTISCLLIAWLYIGASHCIAQDHPTDMVSEISVQSEAFMQLLELQRQDSATRKALEERLLSLELGDRSFWGLHKT